MKTLEDFIHFRDNTLGKEFKCKGYYIFDNKTAKLIFDANPSSLRALAKVPGFADGGVRLDKYGPAIVKYFVGSSVFSGTGKKKKK